MKARKVNTNLIDVMIGTFCIHHQLALLHDDRDFDPMVRFLGLDVVDTSH